MREHLKRLVEMRDTYIEQVNNLKEDWKNGRSKFSKEEDYNMQLEIWEKRIKQYDTEINSLINELGG